jgi:hypothetical protein
MAAYCPQAKPGCILIDSFKQNPFNLQLPAQMLATGDASQK